MARNNDRERDRAKRVGKDTRPRARTRGCAFCDDQSAWVDYKDGALLRRYLSDRGKIRARRVSGLCAQHQREVAIAIKTARELALLPYAQRTVSERGPGRGTRSGPGRGGAQSNDTTSTGPDDDEDFDDVADHNLEEVDA